MVEQNDRQKKLTTSCGCFIVRKGDKGLEVLLVKPFVSRENWGVPKGHINPDESYVDCALREVNEETGLTPEIVTQYELPTCTARSHNETKTVRIFMAVLREHCDIVSDGENADIAWFGLDDLPQIHKYQESVIKEAVVFAKEMCCSPASPQYLG